jgi:hypothetical protein
VNGTGIGNGTKWNTFFQFNIGHLLIIISMCSTALWWFVTFDRDFTIAKLTLAQQVKTTEILANRVEGIDNNGTRFSQKNIDKEFDLYKNAVERITHLEQSDNNFMPKFEQFSYRMQTVFDFIDEQKRKQQP